MWAFEIEDAAGTCIDVVDHRHRTEIVAPSLAAIEEANQEGEANDEGKGGGEGNPVGVVEKGATNNAERKKAELEIVMMAPQPGIGWQEREHAINAPRTAVELLDLTLPAEHARDLADMRERTHPAPSFVTKEHQCEGKQRQYHRPEDPISHRIRIAVEWHALHDGRCAAQMEWACQVVRRCQCGSQRVP